MARLAFLLLLPACSSKTTISPEIYATSWHSRPKPSGESYNQFNPGVGFALTQPVSTHWKAGIRAATYKNSIAKQSVLAAGTIEWCQGDEFHACAGVMGGGVTGYAETVRPLLAPVIGVGYQRVTLNVTTFPIQAGRGVAVSGWVSIKLGEF